LPRADVVERSEYNKMVLAFRERVKNQKDNLIATRDAYYQIEKEEAELHNKIDEAIKEMEKFKEEVESINDLYAQSCVTQCIAILKENIGEK
jgi:DNA-binding transcriptional regulator/RsmH inhibitor MraZ